MYGHKSLNKAGLIKHLKKYSRVIKYSFDFYASFKLSSCHVYTTLCFNRQNVHVEFKGNVASSYVYIILMFMFMS